MSKLMKIEEIKSNLRVALIWLVVWAIIAVYWLGYYTALIDKKANLQIVGGKSLPPFRDKIPFNSKEWQTKEVNDESQS